MLHRLFTRVLALLGIQRDRGSLRYVGTWEQQDDGTWMMVDPGSGGQE